MAENMLGESEVTRSGVQFHYHAAAAAGGPILSLRFFWQVRRLRVCPRAVWYICDGSLTEAQTWGLGCIRLFC